MNKFKSGFSSFMSFTSRKVNQMQTDEGRNQIKDDMAQEWQKAKAGTAAGLEFVA